MNLSSPKKPFKILLISQEDNELNNIGLEIKKRFGLIHISVTSILNSEIYNKTSAGREILQNYQNKEEISKELLCGLINERIKKNDTKVHGFVLEGKINTKEKIKILKDLNINFNYIFILNKNENSENLEKWNEFKEFILESYPEESINLELNNKNDQNMENLMRTINYYFENKYN